MMAGDPLANPARRLQSTLFTPAVRTTGAFRKDAVRNIVQPATTGRTVMTTVMGPRRPRAAMMTTIWDRDSRRNCSRLPQFPV